MADIHNIYGHEKDDLIIKTIDIFREIANRILIEVESNFLFEYINQHNQFDVIEFPETDDKIFPKFIKIDNDLPNCFISGLKYYRNI